MYYNNQIQNESILEGLKLKHLIFIGYFAYLSLFLKAHVNRWLPCQHKDTCPS